MKRILPLFIFFCLFLSSFLGAQEKKLKLILTSNLEGNFLPDPKNENDPLYLLSSALISEQQKTPNNLVFDLGNSFYPGALSKYSYGSAMMDFFHYTGYKAVLISSMDIRIGFENLSFLQKDKKTLLLASNLLKGKEPLFHPCYEWKSPEGKKIVFIGISSKAVLFNVSEKKLRQISIQEAEDAIDSILERYEDKDNTQFILLSGLSHDENLIIMKKYPVIAAVIGGGDNTGGFGGIHAEQVLLADHRSIYYLVQKNGFYTAELEFEKGLKIKDFTFNIPEQKPTSREPAYLEFVKRLTIWKNQFVSDKNKVLARFDGKSYSIDDKKMALLMREYFYSEIAVLKKGSVVPVKLDGIVRESDLYKLFSSSYPFLKFTLTGAQLKKISQIQNEFVINGYDAKQDKVHGYPLDSALRYSVVSSQSGYEMIMGILEEDMIYRNTWKTFTDVLERDIHLQKSDSYSIENKIDSYFFSHLNFNFSFFYDQSSIAKNEDMDTPAGQPDISYSHLGTESTLNWVLYNRWHEITFTPSINYEKKTQDSLPGQLINNLLRGTLVYRYNSETAIKPYQKSQLDTVVKSIEGLRPALIRETVGSSLVTDLIEGNLGAGFEKKIHEPVLAPQYGLEFLFKLKWSILDNLTFKSSLDFFWSQGENNKAFSSLKTQMQNGFYYNFTEDFGISLRYNWFYYYSGEFKESYSYSQIFTAIDLKTDFKIY